MAEPAGTPEPRSNGRRLAIVSIICGALGFATCGLSAILGLILGILLLPALLGIGAAILMPAVMNARGHAYQAAFMSNLKQLSVATMGPTPPNGTAACRRPTRGRRRSSSRGCLATSTG